MDTFTEPTVLDLLWSGMEPSELRGAPVIAEDGYHRIIGDLVGLNADGTVAVSPLDRNGYVMVDEYSFAPGEVWYMGS